MTYGLTGRIAAVPSKREERTRVLLEGTADLPGCPSYVVAEDPTDADALWVTGARVRAASHRAAPSLPGVQVAISVGRPLIAPTGDRVETVPVAGHGLAAE